MQNKITQAILLSAGFGTRLRSMFPDLPKVMVPMLGKPFLEWHIEQLKKHGITEFFINLHYMPDMIRNYFGDGSKWSVKITYVLEEPEIRGTAGGVKNFDHMVHDDFFVLYADVFMLIDYSKMIEAFYSHKSAIGMEIVGVNDHPHDSDLVTVNKDLKFLKVHPRPNPNPPENWRAMRTGFIFNEKIMNYIPVNAYYEIDHQVIPELLAKGESFYGYETKDFMKDAGTPERYKEVEEYLKKNLPR